MRKLLSKIYIVLILVFLYAPIGVLIVFSFNSSKSRSVWEGFTFKWYMHLFQDVQVLKALSNTLIIAVLSMIFATILGTAAALGMHCMKSRSRKFLVMLTNIPMLSPEIVTGVSLMMLFVFIFKSTGILSPGLWTLVLAHTTFCLPYVIFSVLPKFRQINPNLYEAALDLGCTPCKAFFYVILPQILSGIISGAVLSFTLSIDDFVITYFTSGTLQTLPTVIYSMTRKMVSPEINALSAILFLLVFLLSIEKEKPSFLFFSKRKQKTSFFLKKKKEKNFLLF